MPTPLCQASIRPAVSRRSLLTASASVAALAPAPALGQETPGAPSPDPRSAAIFDLTVNNQLRHLSLDARTTLLDAPAITR
jgi:xanthine dehydrogenase YagT iron-sulfur-binding subunit